MRTFRHWSLRYVTDRLGAMWHVYRHPGRPWITRAAHDILASFLRKTDVGLEFGSGRSTVWFARRVAHLTSVEHDPAWHQRVNALLASAHLANVESHLFPTQDTESSGTGSDYVKVAQHCADASLDFVLVDGIHRALCALFAMDKVRPGGLLIIDNVNWFLPSDSRAPASVRSASELSDDWNAVHQRLSAWRRIWTSDGVTDTAIFFKPHG